MSLNGKVNAIGRTSGQLWAFKRHIRMRVLDLFSGIGGFSLGLERAGMRTVAFCECDPYCCAVLAKHWPDVPIFTDIRELSAETLGITKGNGRGAGRAGGSDPTSARQQQPERALQIDVICGGFPCQDISVAGKGAGIEGERSGLWSEYARIIGEVRPRYVIVENVAALLGRGLDRVLGDLAALGFDAEWHCIPASAVGAPHRRDRLWLVAYAAGNLWRTLGNEISHALNRAGVDVADTRHDQSQKCQSNDGIDQQRSAQRRGAKQPSGVGAGCGDVAWNYPEGTGNDRSVAAEDESDVAYAACDGWTEGESQSDSGGRASCRKWPWQSSGTCSNVPDTHGPGLSPSWPQPVRAYWQQGGGVFAAADWWRTEPDVGRVAHGIPARVDRLRALGNAVVPQIAEIIGRAIMSTPDRVPPAPVATRA